MSELSHNLMGNSPEISAKAFSNIQTLIYKIAGINLTTAKKSLVVGRLSKRLRKLKLPSFEAYYDLLISNQEGVGQEVQLFVDLLTTNETYFFREQLHFDFLVDKVIPLFKDAGPNSAPLSVWSAASSSGEEGYTLCMLLAEHLGIDNGWRILGSDISATILADAKAAIYNEQRVRLVPASYRHKYLLKGTGSQKGYVAVVPELKRHIKFDSFNLVEGPVRKELFDVIFCRNVMIYFDHDTKNKVINRLIKCLKPGGYLISGRSESLHSLTHDLTTVVPSIYQKKG